MLLVTTDHVEYWTDFSVRGSVCKQSDLDGGEELNGEGAFDVLRGATMCEEGRERSDELSEMGF